MCGYICSTCLQEVLPPFPLKAGPPLRRNLCISPHHASSRLYFFFFLFIREFQIWPKSKFYENVTAARFLSHSGPKSAAWLISLSLSVALPPSLSPSLPLLISLSLSLSLSLSHSHCSVMSRASLTASAIRRRLTGENR